MAEILFVLRTGSQWKSLDGTGMVSDSTMHRRFLEWVEKGVFLDLRKEGLLDYDGLEGIDWRWLSMDGTMTKAPPRKKNPNPYRPRKKGTKRSLPTEGQGIPFRAAADGANRHDSQFARPTIDGIPIERPTPTQRCAQHMCSDKAYDSILIRELLREIDEMHRCPPSRLARRRFVVLHASCASDQRASSFLPQMRPGLP